MKPFVDSQLTGKWYRIAHTYSRLEMMFVEVFMYLSISYENYLDLLYVGIKEDRSKILKKFTLKILRKNDEIFIILRKGLFRKKLRILMFDEKNGMLVLADDKVNCLTIYSRKSDVDDKIVERCLSAIDFLKFNKKEIELCKFEMVHSY